MRRMAAEVRDAHIHAVRIAVAALAVGGLAACGHDTSSVSHGGSANDPAPLNDLSAQQVIGAIAKAGLPALNPHDVTAAQCPVVHCAQAVGTDTVSVYKFATTGQAQKYAGSISSVYQVEDIAVVFAPTVTEDLKQDYEAVVARTAA
jgi:hypothetical protein